MTNYSVKLVESSKELTKKETVMFKDLSDAVNLSEFIDEHDGAVMVDVESWVELAIHNENAKDGQNKDYTNFVVVDKNGTRYYTGSESFWSSFKDIWCEMSDSTEEWSLKVYKKQSKGKKDFITCSVM
nr:MAG TPA_asm: hypothetical protein [Caudoviricetes sp.]